MTRRFADGFPRLSRASAVAAATVTLAGCGVSVPTNPTKAIGDAAQVSAAIARATQRALNGWCPQAFEDNAEHLTHNEATACLKRAETGYLNILHKAGFDPNEIVNGVK